jgi:hypothetical protein
LQGYEVRSVQGLAAPKNTPAEIVDKINKEINAGLVDSRLKGRFADLGGAVFPGSPADFGKFMAEETEKWAKVVKFQTDLKSSRPNIPLSKNPTRHKNKPTSLVNLSQCINWRAGESATGHPRRARPVCSRRLTV